MKGPGFVLTVDHESSPSNCRCFFSAGLLLKCLILGKHHGPLLLGQLELTPSAWTLTYSNTITLNAIHLIRVLGGVLLFHVIRYHSETVGQLTTSTGSGYQYTPIKNRKGFHSSVQLERTDAYFICIPLLLPFLNNIQILEMILFQLLFLSSVLLSLPLRNGLQNSVCKTRVSSMKICEAEIFEGGVHM